LGPRLGRALASVSALDWSASLEPAWRS